MSQARIRVVVGQGPSPRSGLLRFVLEGDGYDVVGEATTSADLARLLAEERPDVVVLDDQIGATAPQVVREIAPEAKIVLVWPGAVVPIGGDARVEPAQVLRELGPTVAKVAGVAAAFTMIDRPDWIEKVRKDPATLREMLEKRGGLPTKRPSVTELQRRGRRLHPTPAAEEDDSKVGPVIPFVAAAASTEPTIELPVTPETGEPVLHLPQDEDAGIPAAAGAGSAAYDPTARAMNRRLGAIALGGAAAIGAIVLSIALAGSRVPTEIILAERPQPTVQPTAPPSIPPSPPGDDEPEPSDGGGQPGPPDGGGAPGDRGDDRSPVNPTGEGPAPGTGGPTGGGSGQAPEPQGPGPGAGGGNDEPPAIPGGATEPPPAFPEGGAAPVSTRTSAPAPTPTVSAPGRSGEQNPHGAPPGKTDDPRDTARGGPDGAGGGHGFGGGAGGGDVPDGGDDGGRDRGPSGKGAKHWGDGLPGHAGEHGHGLEHGQGLSAHP